MKNPKLLSVVPFSKFQQWDVKQFFLSEIKSSYPVEKLGEHLIHQTNKILPSDFPDDDFDILGISNKIGMFDAYVKKGKKISQKYHVVEEGWIAYNPYRINVGSIGIKTPELKGNLISPAYVVFSCKETLLPEYLWLMMTDGFFNSLIRKSTTGSVRQTLHFERLAEIEAPIPSIPEQERLVQKYHEMFELSEEKVAEGNNVEENLLFDIQREVSTLYKDIRFSKTDGTMLQTVSFTSTNRWEVDYILKEGRLATIYDSFKYESYCINDLQTESLFGLSVKASPTQKDGMIPMLRMSNIINGEIDCRELKYLPYKCAVTEQEPRKWLLEKGDFLINRTNSKELVGKAAVFNLEGDYTYASYVIRYRFNTALVLPEYVNIMFMLPLVRKQIDAVSRQTAGQCNINSDEIGAIRIPVPPIPIQQDIVDKYNSIKGDAKHYYGEAEELKREAADDFEKAIFA